jgi:hypothetical protein
MRTAILGEMIHIGANFVEIVDKAACYTMNNCLRQYASDISYDVARLTERITKCMGGICLPLSKEGATS